MTLTIISGGQTGADQAGLFAARSAGLPTGGWAPLGWKTEDGPAPWLAAYGLVECPEPGYRARTKRNVRDSDGTIWFGAYTTRGFRATHDEALALRRPFLIVYGGITLPREARAWIRAEGIRRLNVAGNRESGSPGIRDRTETFLGRMFRGMEK